MWEQHGLWIRWHSRLPTQRRDQPGRIDTQQHKVGPAAVEPVGRQMHLFGS